jgi:hypothetical protein
MDLRSLRKHFLDKKLAYACSYEHTLSFDGDGVRIVPGGLRLRPVQKAPKAGRVFHVFDHQWVPGLDGRAHDVPEGEIEQMVDSILVREGENVAERWSVGTIEGRMTLRTSDEIVIPATYSGTVQLAAYVDPCHIPEAIAGKAFVIPIFDASHPKYHWLTEQACIAFGIWELRDNHVKASFDVYLVE